MITTIIKRIAVWGTFPLILLTAAASSEINLVRLPNHVPFKAVAAAQHIGRLDASTPISLAVAMPLRNQSALADLIRRQNNPSDPLYGHYLTPAQFEATYAPTTDDVSQVAQYLTDLGLTVTQTRAYVVDVQGTASAVEKAFQLELHQYETADSRAVYAPLTDPVVEADMAPKISGIIGLNTFSNRVAHREQMVTPHAGETIGTGPNGALAPSDIKTAYSLNTISVTGAGQTLGLFELDGYAASDIQAYTKEFNINTPPTLQNVLVDGFSGTPGSGADEVTLDIELMMAVAPGVNKIMVYEGPNSDAGVIDTYTQIAKDDLATEVSTSWGEAEDASTSADLQAENTVFMQIASQGQSIYAASGDSGAYDDGTNLGVDDPASQPYMVGVGGTTLSVNNGESYKSESSWGIAAQGQNAEQGGGGGISTTWKIPSFQVGVANANNSGSTTMRMVPDVSFDANPNTGYAIYVGGAWNIFGGTSCAAPIWAAFTALVNQQRKLSGLPNLGFADPAIYQVATSSLYGADFHDISDGTTNLFYKTTAGYDLATGWGSFVGSKLFSALTSATLPPSAPAAVTLAGLNTVINVSWTPSGTSQTYSVYRSASSSGPFSVALSNSAATSFNDSGLTDGTTYYYYVTATNSAGQSGNSAMASAAPQQVAPQAPTNFQAVLQ